MSPEYVLKAAINSMINGHHEPNCFRARVQGKGYINDGSPQYDRRDYLKQLERSATSELENMDYALCYAEPGYEQPKAGILFADWNPFPRNIGTILEKMGFAVEWSDEWSTCENCNGAFRTQPNSYHWTPAWKEDDGSILCLSCYEKEHKHDNEEEEEENANA